MEPFTALLVPGAFAAGCAVCYYAGSAWRYLLSRWYEWRYVQVEISLLTSPKTCMQFAALLEKRDCNSRRFVRLEFHAATGDRAFLVPAEATLGGVSVCFEDGQFRLYAHSLQDAKKLLEKVEQVTFL